MDDSDTSSGVLYDRSAYNNHGTLNGPSQTTGLFNGAYSFEDDNNDYVDLGVVGNEFAIGRGDYTFSVWANFESITSSSTIFELSRYTDSLLVRPDNNGPQLQIYMRNQETNDTFFPNIEGNTGKWYHLVIRRTGGVLEVFENNTSLGTKSEMDGVFEINQESYIGKSVHTNNQNHDGLLQDMRFYDRALSKNEISALYNIRSQRQQNIATLINTTVNGKDVTLQNDSFGSWICVQNYEHYGGTDPSVSPGSTFPQLPDGDRLISDIENDGQNGELRHVDNISQYGDWEVDAVRLEAETQNHSRKINYYSKNQSVIDSIVNNSVDVGHSELKSSIEKYPDHTSFLPDNMAGDNDNQTSPNSNRIFGFEFPMFGDGSDGTRVHWAMSGNGNRWEVDDYHDGPGQTTIHRVWVRTGLF